MELKKFRTLFCCGIGLLILLSIVGVIYTVFFYVNNMYTSTGMFYVNVIGYGAGVFFLIFQFRLVLQSFKNGTLLLGQICFTKERKRRKATGICSAVALAIGLVLTVIFILCRCNVFPSTTTDDYLTYEFLIYFGSFVLIESLFVLLYFIFERLEDITAFN